jgi:PAS domain S-box-containing protein
MVKTLGFQSYACVPLRAKDRVVGVMDVADRRIRLTADDLHLLTAIGNQVGVAVENARLYAHVQQTANYLNALIESSGDAMITMDHKGWITSWNRGAEEIYGLSREEALGQFLPMVPPELRPEAMALYARTARGETLRNLEVRRQHNDGHILDVVVTVSPLYDAAGKIMGGLGISKDVSELKRLQRELLAQQRNLAVLEERERIGMDLHDGVIQSLYSVGLRLESCLALVSSAPEEVTRRLERATDDVTNIIKQIRDYVFDLRAHQLHGRRLTEGLVELAQELRVSTLLPVEVIADEAAQRASERLSEAQATNLFLISREALTNILKHARASEATVQLSASDGILYLTVKDDGIGFDLEVARSGGGDGLRNIAERAKLLGARLNVNSHPGAGTEIGLEIPLVHEAHNG